MKLFNLAHALPLVLLLAVVAQCAPSNSTSSKGPSKAGTQVGGNSAPVRSGVSSTTKPFRSAPSALPSRPVAASTVVRKINSTRATRDTQQVGGHAPIVPSRSNNNSSKTVSTHAVRSPSPISSSNNNSTKTTSTHTVKGSTLNASSSKNSTRHTRSTKDSEHSDFDGSEDHAESVKPKSNSNSSSPISSTHPLFANRHSSNITDSLRPKLRSHIGGLKKSSNNNDTSSASSTEEKDNKSSEIIHTNVPTGQQHKQSSSSEESISVVSTGPVSVLHSRNSSRPALRNPALVRRISTSSTGAPAENEDVEIFIL